MAGETRGERQGRSPAGACRLGSAIRLPSRGGARDTAFPGQERGEPLPATLEVIEAITSEAILNCASLSVMPWRRAIQAKSVLVQAYSVFRYGARTLSVWRST